MDKKKIISYKYDLIKVINNYRNNHGVRSLKSDFEIDREAQYLAEKLSQKGHHYKIPSLDETIYITEKYLPPAKLAQTLYNENSDYDFNSDNPEPSNFTRMVWKNCDLIGFGMSKSPSKQYIFVIKYFPTGNRYGQFQKNVFPFGTPFCKAFYVEDKDKKVPDKPLSNEHEDFYRDALAKHNYYRRIHHVGPLTLNYQLCRIAENYSRRLAFSIRGIVHSRNQYKNEELGENIHFCQFEEPTGSSATTDWYSEIKDHDFNDNYGNFNTGHFTQVVWKDSKEVGFGVTKNESDQYFVVANYYPPGNIYGTFKENVFAP